jgi:hypothetical protein
MTPLPPNATCGPAAIQPGITAADRERIYAWINEITAPETRETALLELRYSVVESILWSGHCSILLRNVFSFFLVNNY